MPSRLLREGIIDSEAVNSLSPEGEVFYRRLMSIVDDYGCFDGRTSILRGRLYALQLDRVREVSLERWIAECVTVRLIRLYSHDGKPYVQLLKLGTPRAKEPKYPLPPDELTAECEPLKTVVNNGKPPQTGAPYSDSGSGSGTGTGTEKTPLPPAKPGGEKTAPREKKPGPETVPIPQGIDTPEFRTVWANWLDDRAARGKKVTRLAAERQLSNLASRSTRAIEIVNKAIEMGWTGLVYDQPGKQSAGASYESAPGFDPMAGGAPLDFHRGKR